MALLTDAYHPFSSKTDGANADVYPALATVPPDPFGICVAAINGAVFEVGDTDVEFSIMSISKPFVFALVCGGGIVTVAPGKGGLATFAPPLDAAGNSVKGQLVARELSHLLGFDLFIFSPER